MRMVLYIKYLIRHKLLMVEHAQLSFFFYIP